MRTSLVVVALAAWSLALVSPAWAARVGAGPNPQLSIADGAVLEGPPATLDLTFDSPPSGPVQISLTHDTTHGILLPVATVKGATVHQPMPSPMVRGTYVVAWEGHTASGAVSGHSTFTLTHGIAWPSSGPAPVPTVTTRPVPVMPSSEPAASASATPTASALAVPPSSTAEGAGAGPLVGVLVGLVAVAGLGFVVVRRYRQDGATRGGR